jgi:hypothetical protein
MLEESLERFEDARADNFELASNKTSSVNDGEQGSLHPHLERTPSESATFSACHCGSTVSPSWREGFKEDECWRNFLQDPSQWWDNRFDKRNPRALDFKHKITKKGLWISGRTTPDWVREKFNFVEKS